MQFWKKFFLEFVIKKNQKGGPLSKNLKKKFFSLKIIKICFFNQFDAVLEKKIF
jgi:hypothetical protein